MSGMQFWYLNFVMMFSGPVTMIYPLKMSDLYEIFLWPIKDILMYALYF